MKAQQVDKIDKRLQERYKYLFTQIVLRLLVVVSGIALITHWYFGASPSTSGMIVLGIIIVANTYFTKKNRLITTPWGIIESRSDAFDTLRWCINLPVDLYIFWSLDLHPSVAPIAWFLPTFGAMMDVYEKRNKYIVLVGAFISFIILITVLYPVNLETAIYLTSCYLGLVYVLWSLERFIFDEMTQVYEGQLQRERIEKEAQQLQREAAIGRITRSLSHELNTLLSVATLSAARIRRKPEDIMRDLSRVDKSLSYMSKVSTLILDDLGNKNAPIRCISLAELLHDIRLLLCNGEKQCYTLLAFDFPTNSEKFYFKERTGSTYLIINNLVKNAHDAILEKFSNEIRGTISVCAKVTDNEIVISVADNGVGLSSMQLNDIQRQKSASSKITGHGLGLRFVQRECQLNGFELMVSSEQNKGSIFIITGLQLVT